MTLSIFSRICQSSVCLLKKHVCLGPLWVFFFFVCFVFFAIEFYELFIYVLWILIPHQIDDLQMFPLIL